MRSEFMAYSGNNVIFSSGDDCYVFDNNGSLISTAGSLLEGYNIREIKIFSAITDGDNYYEIYFNGKKKYFVGNMVIDVMGIIARKYQYLEGIFHYNCKGSDGSLINCILLPYDIDVLSNEKIDVALNGKAMSDWEDL